jgi:hypothetical protein
MGLTKRKQTITIEIGCSFLGVEVMCVNLISRVATYFLVFSDSAQRRHLSGRSESWS